MYPVYLTNEYFSSDVLVSIQKVQVQKTKTKQKKPYTLIKQQIQRKVN